EDLRGASVSEVRNVTVKEVPPLEIAVFRVGYKNVYDSGEVIPLAARAEGGRGRYRYKFYLLDYNGEEIVLRDYAYSNIYSWTPEFDGSYEVHVSVKDSNGTEVDEQRWIHVGPPV
ncbi:MAG: triple tyrosine motif-containing protein, partial [Bacillota bacterium]|nr:triple tyrosine motif-containing protein [Bacillota bacterium]